MFQFNVNQPIDDPRLIAAAINDYQTPEAAEADFRSNAPQGMDYLTQQYQRLTGDAFADPFADASKRRADAMTQAALGGASIATGSNTGMRLLQMPTGGVSDSTAVDLGIASRAPRPMALPPRMLPMRQAPGQVATLQQPMSAPAAMQLQLSNAKDGLAYGSSVNEDTARATLYDKLQESGALDKLNSVGSARFPSHMQIPAVDELPVSPVGHLGAGYKDTIKRRADMLGVGPEFDAIEKSDPKAFIPTGEDLSNDPLFAKMQGPNGKALAGDIHSVVFNPKFREYLQNDPEKASKIYLAATNQDFSTARNAKIQQYIEERGQQEKILEGFKGLTTNPVTGEVFHTVEKKDQFGDTITKTKVPLDPVYVKMLEARGGRVAGVRLPGFGGIRAQMPGAPEKFYKDYTDTYQQIRQQNPNLSDDQHVAMTDAAMKSGKKGTITAGRSADNPTGADLLGTMMQFGAEDVVPTIANAAISGANATNKLFNMPTRAANAVSAMIGSDWRAQPTWDENMPLMDAKIPSEIAKARGAAAEALRQRLGAGGAAFSGEAPVTEDRITAGMRQRALAAKARRMSPDLLRRLLPQYFDQPAMAGQ
jgi:hypothetical protein